MTFDDILQALVVFGTVAGLGFFFYSYYTKAAVKNAIDKILPFLPILLSLVLKKVPNKENEFDAADGLIILQSVVLKIRETVSDPNNISFADVQDEVFELIDAEFERLRQAGVEGVPNLNDEMVRKQISLVFETIQKAFNNDDTSGDDSQD